MTPRLPDADPHEQPPSEEARNAATCLAAAALLGGASLLALLVFFVLPVAVGYVLLAVVAVFGMLVLHYLVWGRLLMRITQEEGEADESDR